MLTHGKHTFFLLLLQKTLFSILPYMENELNDVIDPSWPPIFHNFKIS